MVKQSSSFTFGSRPPIEGAGARRFFAELSTTLLVTLTLLALSVLAWLGLMAAGQVFHQQGEALLKDVDALKNEPKLGADFKKLADFQRAVIQTHQLFASQTFLSRSLDFLEQSTHRQVRWTALNFEISGKVDTGDLKDEEKKVLEALTAGGGLSLAEINKETGLADASGALSSLLKANRVQLLGGNYAAFAAFPGTVNLTGNAASYRALAEQMVAITNLRNIVSKLTVRQVSVSADGGVSFVMQIQLKPALLRRAAPAQAAAEAN